MSIDEKEVTIGFQFRHADPRQIPIYDVTTLNPMVEYLSYFYYFSCPTTVLLFRAYPSIYRRTIFNSVDDHNLISAEKNTSPRKNTKCKKAQVGEKSRSARQRGDPSEVLEMFLWNIMNATQNNTIIHTNIVLHQKQCSWYT